jgi:hypothetical protein
MFPKTVDIFTHFFDTVLTSVADPACLSRIRDPDFYPSRIPDFGSKNSNYFNFEMQKKKIGANFQRIIELFTQKNVTKLSKLWVWDPGSEIRKKPFPDPGSRGQKSNGSRIRNTNTNKKG